METSSVIKHPKMVVDSKVARWMEISPRLSDFSIEYILSSKGPGTQNSRCEYNIIDEYNTNDQESNSTKSHQFDWLQCTRYRPPKLQRARRKEGRQRRKLGRNPRIPFSGTQVAVLEDRFRLGHYLSSAEVEKLSSLLCLSETRVKIWFQNRRARDRRERELNERNTTEINCAEETPQKSVATLSTSLTTTNVCPKKEFNLKGTSHSLLSSIRSAFSPCQPLYTKRILSSTVDH